MNDITKCKEHDKAKSISDSKSKIVSYAMYEAKKKKTVFSMNTTPSIWKATYVWWDSSVLVLFLINSGSGFIEFQYADLPVANTFLATQFPCLSIFIFKSGSMIIIMLS